MWTQKIRDYVGVAGVVVAEAPLVHVVAKSFRALMVAIAIWLPLQLYLESKHLIPPRDIIVSNWIIWTSFFAETTVLLILVKHKRLFLKGNWLNLIIIVAGFPLLWSHTPIIAILRWVQFILILRLLVPTWDAAMSILSRNHLGATLIVAFLFIALWGILIAAVDPAFQTPWDGIWWAWETATTVGYGDIVPQSAIGRILAAFLMLIGIALISLLTANFSAYFINKGIRPRKMSGEFKLLVQMQQQLDQIQKHLARLEKDREHKS